MNTIHSEFDEALSLIALLSKDMEIAGMIRNMADRCVEALNKGGKIIFAGNGGSAADAQHFACELVGRFHMERKALPAVALSTDTSVLTSIGNDYGFQYVFRRQLEACASSKDVFIAISTSGRSQNIILALEYCKEVGVPSLGLSGGTGGSMAKLCDVCIVVPSQNTPRIQEAHTLIGHILCSEIERGLFRN